MSSFYHDLLLKSTTSFRLLEINPELIASDNGDALISCRLYMADLADGPHYTALSYVWGSPDVTKEILVNGKIFPIRENLWNFLDHARKATGVCAALWADAICIDQSAILERNHQVSIMGEIYSNAKQVVSWLGLGDAETLKLAGQLESLELNISQETDGSNPAMFRELMYLLSHEYWTRVWIVQEVTLAKDLRLWVGPYSFSKNSLLRMGEKTRLGLTYTMSYTLELTLGNRILRLSKPAAGMTFDSLLALTKSSQCSEPGDRIFAVLSLVRPEDRDILCIAPDYSRSSEELYYDVLDRLYKQPELNGWSIAYYLAMALGTNFGYEEQQKMRASRESS